MTLPLFYTKERKFIYGVIMTFTLVFLYSTSNHYHLYEPVLLPMWWIDRHIPFIPDTLWIYVSEYFLFIGAYHVIKSLRNVNIYIYSLLGLQIFSVLIFWFFPTTYPRDLYPLTGNENFITHWGFSVFRSFDTPANCAPSLHVSGCYLTSFMFLKEQRSKFKWFFGWATAVALSTLTTKQHYLVDCITGLICAIVFYYLFNVVIKYRWAVPNQDEPQANR